VVDRPQQQHGVDGAVAQAERAGVGDGRADQAEAVGVGPELVDVQRDEVAVLDPVAAPGQPHGVAAGAAADVGHHRGRRGSRRSRISLVRSNSSTPRAVAVSRSRSPSSA